MKKIDTRLAISFACLLFAIMAAFLVRGAFFGSDVLADNSSAVLSKTLPKKLTKFKALLDQDVIIAPDPINSAILRSLSAKEGVVALSRAVVKGPEVGQQFLKEYGVYFGVKAVDTELKLALDEKDASGGRYLGYQQYYQNIPVYGGAIVVRVEEGRGVRSAQGKFIPSVLLNTQKRIERTRALDLVKSSLERQYNQKGVIVNSAELTVLNSRTINPRSSNRNYLAWRALAEDGSGWEGQVFLDASNGSLLFVSPLVKRAWGVNIPTTQDIFGRDEITRRVYDCQPDGCTAGSTTSSAKVTDPDIKREEGKPATGQPDVDRAYTLVGSLHEYVKSAFGLAGANDYGGIGKFFDTRHPLVNTDVYSYFVATSTLGFCPNAYGGPGSLKFCPNVVNTMVVGHEYGHAISGFNGPQPDGLTYSNESGAIEEAIADVFGQGFERYSTNANSWQIGPLPALWRNITNPEDTAGGDCPCPRTHYAPEFFCGNWDNGGVHRNSTVVSHLAYLLSEGGRLNGCAIQPIGLQKVEQVFFHAVDNNLTADADFMDLYLALKDSCGALYGAKSETCQSFITAMQAAELDQPGACSGTPKTSPSCSLPQVGVLGNVEVDGSEFNTLIPGVKKGVELKQGQQLPSTRPTVPRPRPSFRAIGR